jgi:glycogen debranching enzyme
MNIVINEAPSFLITNKFGDIEKGAEQGLYDSDTRFLSLYQLQVNGHRPLLLSGRQVDYYSAVHYLTNDEIDDLKANSISIVRNRFIGDGLHEDLDIQNYSLSPVRLVLELKFDVDFADIFEVKSGKLIDQIEPELKHYPQNQAIAFRYENKEIYRETKIIFTSPAKFSGKSAIFEVYLEPYQRWHVCVDFLTLATPKVLMPKYSCASFNLSTRFKQEYLSRWMKGAATIRTDYDPLKHAFSQSLRDLAALRLRGKDAFKSGFVPAAGIPWFMTSFGRDSLITALQTIAILPEIAEGVLRTLARYQGKKVDPESEEQPGKIIHEIRFGRLTKTRNIPKMPYYGTIDATPLFIILLSETFRWTGRKDLLEELKEPLLLAVDWIGKYGDLDGDGYIEYKQSAAKGLSNQGWKDSYDSVRFADGSFAEPPIALCEVQGYVYDAKMRAAELIDVLDEKDRSQKLIQEARELKIRFNQDFWLEEKGYFAEALDGQKRPVDSITSNAGHLLWSGIVEEEKAVFVKDRLLAPDMFSGWGIRTMSAQEKAYNPVSYHNGSIWPHDNSIIIAGLYRYGFYQEAIKIMNGLLGAASYFENARLPELFCGFSRSESRIPIDYPTSSSPQAWASGTLPFMVTTMAGLEAQANRQLKIKPSLVPGLQEVVYEGIKIASSHVSFSLRQEDRQVKVEIIDNPADIDISVEEVY